MLLLLLLSTLCSKSLQQQCSIDGCSGHYALVSSSHKTLNITGHRHHAELTITKETISASILNLQGYWNYEYEGGALDKNSGCRPQYVYPTITIGEARSWDQRKMCKVGNRCAPEGDCWGSSADECLPGKREYRNTWVSEQSFSYLGDCYYFWPHHTCVKDWACSVKTFDFPVHINANMKPSTSLLNGTAVDLVPTENLFDLGKGSYLFINKQSGENLISREICEVECISQGDDKEVCVTGDSCSHPNIPLKRMENGKYCSRHICAYKGTRLHSSGPSDNPDRAASIMDVTSLKTFTQAEVMRIDLNSAKMLGHIDELESVLLRLTRHLAKTDPRLLGKILGKEVMTHFLSENQFTLCPCLDIKPSIEEICNPAKEPSYQFSDGVYRVWDKTSKCLKPANNASLTNIQLVTDEDYKEDHINSPDAVGASYQWEGWLWLAAYKEDLLWTVRETKNQYNGGVLENFNFPLFNKWGMLFASLSSSISYIALFLSLVAYCRTR